MAEPRARIRVCVIWGDNGHIFEKGGITGGVWEARKRGGVTVERNRTRRDLEVLESEKDQGAVYEKAV